MDPVSLLFFLLCYVFIGVSLKYLDLVKRPSMLAGVATTGAVIILASLAIGWLSASDETSFAIMFAIILASALAGKLNTYVLKVATVAALLFTMVFFALLGGNGINAALFALLTMAFYFDEELHSHAKSPPPILREIAEHRVVGDAVAVYLCLFGLLGFLNLIGLLLLDAAYQITDAWGQRLRNKIIARAIDS
ncbi:hypothetical protein COT30_03895 [Candidatus Micrarchaeota archaeon CG08_land_8_20_14_0_20_49_17]|nr:MAG: hypothetical protein AUJ13_04475 [Candidatus Micrarchaeota archaeon CG1_02_49_24]PIU09537.1 MAG: hypothetical protein COT30_03895 [Candidatus Micrarchaeota archaeon CG08_land_8_20_14_0_20_49_17]PIU81644.1 MAG: hypothetical protein COS70_03005 [Candidatus Micrarchaeota archaeon CG06_land_8_20_14_3_00_50_6]PIZ97583.1 MAG: hypothetical protein COX84_03030 [Candidatus Micrarchaeota archaeon CG_4_10_14_0_2_um_filter_49_7]HII54342.1 hypothetical protein [Candidatus Micrarchaeota archaeon]